MINIIILFESFGLHWKTWKIMYSSTERTDCDNGALTKLTWITKQQECASLLDRIITNIYTYLVDRSGWTCCKPLYLLGRRFALLGAYLWEFLDDSLRNTLLNNNPREQSPWWRRHNSRQQIAPPHLAAPPPSSGAGFRRRSRPEGQGLHRQPWA